MSSELLTADDIARRLRVPRSWVYRAAREGDLPSVRCGRYRRFDEADVERWISRHNAQAATDRDPARALPARL